MMNRFFTKSDLIGALAGSMCLAHCIVTPLIFVMQPIAVQSNTVPLWWKNIDYLFLLISLFAVYFTSKNTQKSTLKNALWVSWGILSLAILNEKFELYPLPELSVYIPAVALIVLHIYGINNSSKSRTEACCKVN